MWDSRHFVYESRSSDTEAAWSSPAWWISLSRGGRFWWLHFSSACWTTGGETGLGNLWWAFRFGSLSKTVLWQRNFLSDRYRIAKGHQAKWLRGEAAIIHKTKINLEPMLPAKATGTSSSQHLKAPAMSCVLSQSAKLRSKIFQHLGTVEISSSDKDISSLHSHPRLLHQPSSPTIVASSPIWKGKKRSGDVLEISSDEIDEHPMKKEKCSLSQSIIVLSD